MEIKNCRNCGGELSKVLSLGKMPIVNYFPSQDELEDEKKYPLELRACRICGLCQLGFIVPPEKIFSNYHFVTSASEPLVSHLEQLSKICIKEFKLNSRSKILDLGCNDGSFLLNFKKKQMRVVGIEPAPVIAQFAKNRGVEVLSEFFNKENACDIRSSFGQFDLISATRVLANIVDINSFVAGVKDLLSPNGVFVAEVSSLSQMLSKFQFDSIYHEHYSYFSFATLEKILEKHGLVIFKAEETPFQGGELRIFVTHEKGFAKKIKFEEKIASHDYVNFAKHVRSFKKDLNVFFDSHKSAVIAGFGAPAKGVTLLNYCGLGVDKISFIVDSTLLKQGRFFPGLKIPIHKEAYLKGRKVDYCLILAWNYSDEILKKLKKINKERMRAIIPLPNLEIIDIRRNMD